MQDKIVLDLKKPLTIGEKRELKRLARELVDMDWSTFQAGLTADDPDAVAVFAFWARRRTDPSVTFEDVQNWEFDLVHVETDSGDEDPTNAAGSTS